MRKDKSQEAIAPPSDAITVNKKSMLPDVFRQDNRYYYKDNMPNNPNGELTVWFQSVNPDLTVRLLKLRAEKLALEAEIGQIFI